MRKFSSFQLIPLYVCIGLGAAAAVFYTARLAIRSPEVTWSRKNNPEPWEEYRNKQHKVSVESAVECHWQGYIK